MPTDNKHDWKHVSSGMYETLYQCDKCKEEHMESADDIKSSCPILGCSIVDTPTTFNIARLASIKEEIVTNYSSVENDIYFILPGNTCFKEFLSTYNDVVKLININNDNVNLELEPHLTSADALNLKLMKDINNNELINDHQKLASKCFEIRKNLITIDPRLIIIKCNGVLIESLTENFASLHDNKALVL